MIGTWSIAVQQAALFDSVRVKPETSLKQAADLMLRWHVGGLPVVEDYENVVGMITYTNFVTRVRWARVGKRSRRFAGSPTAWFQMNPFTGFA